MRRTGQDGFAIIVVVMLVALLGMALAILAQVAGVMELESQRALAEARLANLTASAAAWAERHGPEVAGKPPRALDAKGFGIPGAKLTVVVAKGREVRIVACCRYVRGTYRRTSTVELGSGRGR